jgi:hypothetical protein
MIVFARDKAWLTEHDIVLRVEKEGVEEVKAVFEKLRKEYNDDWGRCVKVSKLITWRGLKTIRGSRSRVSPKSMKRVHIVMTEIQVGRVAVGQPTRCCIP